MQIFPCVFTGPMKYFFLLAALLLISPSAAPIPRVVAADPALEQLIGALQNRYLNLTSFSGEFTQLYLAPGEKLRRETGRVLLKKPGRMRWDYHAPEVKLYLSDGRVVIEYVPAEQLATRIRVNEADDIHTPFLFLLGRGNLRRDFRLIEFAVEAPINAGNRVLRLAPKRSQNFRELFIELTPQQNLARLSFVEASGARTDFIFNKVRENIPIEDSMFVFSPPPGVRVVTQ
ncbi:MAG: LolA family protein [Blastocatellia bacterium]